MRCRFHPISCFSQRELRYVQCTFSRCLSGKTFPREHIDTLDTSLRRNYRIKASNGVQQVPRQSSLSWCHGPPHFVRSPTDIHFFPVNGCAEGNPIAQKTLRGPKTLSPTCPPSRCFTTRVRTDLLAWGGRGRTDIEHINIESNS